MRRWSRGGARRWPPGRAPARRRPGRAGRRALLADGHLRLRARLLRPRPGSAHRLPEALAPLPAFSADALDAQRAATATCGCRSAPTTPLVAFHALRTLQTEAAGAAAGALADERLQPLAGRDRAADDRPQPDGPDRRHQQPQAGRRRTSTPRIFVAGAHRRRPGVDGGRLLRGGAADPDAARRLGQPVRWTARSGSSAAASPTAPRCPAAPRRPRSTWTRSTPDGSLVIAGDAHIRVAAARVQRAGRRCCGGRSRTTTASRADGTPDAGLLFVAWQADPLTGFVPVQRKLDRGDALSRVPPARVERPVRGAGRRARPGEYVGQRLLES